MVVAFVWAAVAPADPLRGRQQALLKIAFKNKEGRAVAFAVQRFAGPDSGPGRFERVEVAALAPEGTNRVQVQLLLQSALLESGSMLFDDASLVIVDQPPQN